MKNDDEQSSLMLAVIGIIPVIWFALLVAPYLSSGLMGILEGVPEAMNHPFSIQLCGDSVKTVLIFLLSYGMGIGIYISTKKHYRRGEEHGSAKWGNVKKINRRYKEKRFTKNKLLTMHVQISYNMRKHLRNVLTVVIGGSGSGKTRFFAKPNLMQANTSFVVLDPKGENLRDTGYLLEEKGYEVVNYGTDSHESCDYPVYGEKVGRAVAAGGVDFGIVICGTGLGISLAANKVRGIRAVVCSEPYTARLARQHNDANVLAFGARVIGIELAKMIVDEFLSAKFEGGRHQRRVDMIMDIEKREAE